MKSKKCESCGAKLKYDKENYCYKCEYCGAVYQDVEEQKRQQENNKILNDSYNEELLQEPFNDLSQEDKKILRRNRIIIWIVSIIFLIIFITAASFIINGWIEVNNEITQQNNDFEDHWNDHWNDNWDDNFPDRPNW